MYTYIQQMNIHISYLRRTARAHVYMGAGGTPLGFNRGKCVEDRSGVRYIYIYIYNEYI